MRILRFAGDEKAPALLRWFQTSESIGAATPELYENHMMIFEKLLHDPADKVRMEAPEIFIKDCLDAEEKRLAAAHELGHKTNVHRLTSEELAAGNYEPCGTCLRDLEGDSD